MRHILNNFHFIFGSKSLAAVMITTTILLSISLWLASATQALGQSSLSCYGHIATIVGTPESEDIVGTDGPDVIVTFEGRDRVYALGGNDIICDGSGPNTFVGGAGNDFIIGEDGNDRLEGGIGNDSLFGGAGDVLFGDAIVSGGSGMRNIDNSDGGVGFDTCTSIETVTNCEG